PVQGLAHDGCGHVLTLLILDGERSPLKVHGGHLAVYRVALALGKEGAQRRPHHSRHEKQTHAQGQSLHNSSSTLVQTLNWVGPAYRTPAGSCQVLFPFLVQQFTCPVGPGAPLSNSRKAVPPWSFRPAPTPLHLPSVLESPDGNLAGSSSRRLVLGKALPVLLEGGPETTSTSTCRRNCRHRRSAQLVRKRCRESSIRR